MMKTLTGVALLCALCICPQQICAQPQTVSASQINGTWQSKFGTFKIWALDKGRLQVEFSGVYEYKSASGPTANTGEAKGIASIEGSTAKLRPEGAGNECLITMQFVQRRLEVQQEGTCGFGLNVTAAGTYQRVSAGKPNFGKG